MKTKGYAAQAATTPMAPFEFERRAPGDRDVQIEVDFCELESIGSPDQSSQPFFSVLGGAFSDQVTE